MARQFNETKKITTVTYKNGTVTQAATFIGHLSDSEVERQMLFQRRTPKRCIVGFQHKFN